MAIDRNTYSLISLLKKKPSTRSKTQSSFSASYKSDIDVNLKNLKTSVSAVNFSWVQYQSQIISFEGRITDPPVERYGIKSHLNSFDSIDEYYVSYW